MQMHYTGKKINIALQVKGFKKLNPYVVLYKGIVRAPSFLRGQEIEIKYTHYNAWSLRAVRSPDQLLRAVKLMGFDSVEAFEAEVDASLQAMKIKDTLAVFQGCLQLQEQDGAWGCWVGDAVGVLPINDAIYGYARLQSKTGRAGPRVTADFLYPDQARNIQTLQDLQDFFSDWLCPSIDGVENNGNCLLRIKSVQTPKIVTFWAYAARKEVSYVDGQGRERNFSIPAQLQSTWQEAVVEGRQSAGLCKVVAHALGAHGVHLDKQEHLELSASISDGLSSGVLKIEAIPGQRHRLIGQVLKHVHSSDSHLSRTMAACQLDDGSGIGFFPMMGIVQMSVPSSADHIKEQACTVVVNRVFHEMESKAVKPEHIPVP